MIGKGDQIMRKISIILVLCILLACFVSCGDDNKQNNTPTGTNAPEVTTEAPDNNKEPAEKETETDAPETPIYEWTPRY
jgi:hypothetical protein